MSTSPDQPTQDEDADGGQESTNPPAGGPLMDPDLPPSLDPTSGTTSDESPDR